uniref:Uncharacterized protein n=1 Tax=Lotus japonicus TaxID=34305 RepID=I3T126_LOTJA|nr:unknown [Lotus japonicus]
MDLESENRLAAMLMREAAELRRQAEKEGVLAYLSKPNVRNRPNSRFLTATVLGVQQSNRVVEVNEMWRVRQKEKELDERVRGTSSDKSSGDRSHRDDKTSRSSIGNSTRTSASCSSKRQFEMEVKDTSKDKNSSDRSHRDSKLLGRTGRHAVIDESTSASASCLNKRGHEHPPEGLKDEELEEFLHSRTKRGRGAVGPRMDETGPYLPPHTDGEFLHSRTKRGRGAVGPRMDETGPYLPPHTDGEPSTSPDARERRRVIYGPEMPSSLKLYESSEEETDEDRRRKSKKSRSSCSDKEHFEKRKSKKKSKHKKKKRDEKRSKHHHR